MTNSCRTLELNGHILHVPPAAVAKSQWWTIVLVLDEFAIDNGYQNILDKLWSIAIALYCIDWWFDWFIGWLIDWSFGWLDVIEGYETVEGMVPFCALRAAGLILRMQLQQLLGLKKTLCVMQEKFEISRLIKVDMLCWLCVHFLWEDLFYSRCCTSASSESLASSASSAARAVQDEPICKRATGPALPLRFVFGCTRSKHGD